MIVQYRIKGAIYGNGRIKFSPQKRVLGIWMDWEDSLYSPIAFSDFRQCLEWFNHESCDCVEFCGIEL
jgi:hypothetical protein